MRTKTLTVLGTLAISVMVLSLFSCGPRLRYFNQEMVREYRWDNDEIKRIQFYLSQDVVLWRKLSDQDSRITNGKIRIVDDSEVEEVVIKKNTPGVVLFIPKKNSFAVSFDNEKDNFLMFGPNPKNKNNYVMLAKEWDRRVGKVSYGNQVFNTSSDNAFAGLLVDIKNAKKVKYNSKTASGRRVKKS